MSESSIKEVFKYTITSIPYTIYMSGFLASIVTGDLKYTYFSLLAILMGDIFNSVEKRLPD